MQAEHLIHEAGNPLEALQIVDHRLHLDTPALQMRFRLGKFVGLACGDRHAATHFSQRLGHLQA
jgi:hypothetical protein